jgi:RNA polymerase sigma-70 factor (ECF subfamily)
MDDDAALVQQVLAGHNDAYGELVLRYAGRVLALCHARVGRADLAEELAQEALVRGFEELSSLAEPSRFGPWLAGIAANTCRDWLKSKQNGQVPLSPALAGETASSAADPREQAEEQDEVGRLLREVEALPEECRTVLMLFYYEKASYREIARLLDVSAATVNARLTRARSLLRSRLVSDAPAAPAS